MSHGQARGLRVDLQRPDGQWVAVGRLRHSGERTTFSSLTQYWRSEHRPILGQIFEQREPTWTTSAMSALPTWFSNLLPEGPLRTEIARAAGVNEQREFFLLDRIGGDDLPGAVRVVRIDPDSPDPREGTGLDAEAGDHEQPIEFKFSLAGVQLKFSVADDRGLTVPARGKSGTWIAKLPDRRSGFERVPEAEFAALELARAAGINVPPTRLVDVSSIAGLPDRIAAAGGKAFLIRRFDRRSATQRVHVEELAQVLNVRPSRKYRRANFETVARVTAALTGVASVAQVIDRIVLNVLVGNGDAHVKNWAYVYADGRTAALSPAYDIVPTVLYLPNDNLGLNLDGSKAFSDVTLRSFERLADKAGWDGTLGRQRAADATARVLAAWPVLADHLDEDSVRRLTARRDTLVGLLP